MEDFNKPNYFMYGDPVGIAVNISGGVDSAILTMSLCSLLNELGHDIKIYSITQTNSADPCSAYFANSVMELIKRYYPNQKFEKVFTFPNDVHLSYEARGQFKSIVAHNEIMKLVSEDKINYHFEGWTMNPSEQDEKDFFPDVSAGENRIDDRDESSWFISKDHTKYISYRPFFKSNKKQIVNYARKKFGKDFVNTLYKVSKSCTSVEEYVCMKCWWCHEKEWAFDRI